MAAPDFRHRRTFPGLAGGPFEVLVSRLQQFERTPGILFATLLVAMAAVFGRGDLLRTGVFAVAFFTDWILLAALPKVRISFGPAKGPTWLLALLRAPVTFFAFPLDVLLQGVGTILVVYGFWIEPQWLQLTRQSLVTPKLRRGPPLRLLHFGDLHTERLTRREARLLDIVRTTSPDLILISGDFVSYSAVEDREAWDSVRQLLGQLSAPLGVFAVSGSPPVDQPQILAHISEGTSVRWLIDDIGTIPWKGGDLDVVGVACSHRPFEDGPRLARTLEGRPTSFTVLLYHSPDLAPLAATSGVDLQLSGHTHGGQVRLPFIGALYTASLYGKRFEAGRYSVNGMALYVTRGIGLEGQGAPRVRFLCRPEVTLWEISGTGGA